jgi:hypothetical protein
MTPLRQRMIEDLQPRGMSERTQEYYVRAVRQLADYYHKSPDLIIEEEIRKYFADMKNIKHYSRAVTNITLCGIIFFSSESLVDNLWSLLQSRQGLQEGRPAI